MSDLTDLSWDLGKVATPSLRFLGLFGNALADVNGCLCYIELLELPKMSKLHVSYISLFTSKLCFCSHLAYSPLIDLPSSLSEQC